MIKSYLYYLIFEKYEHTKFLDPQDFELLKLYKFQLKKCVYC